MLDVVVEGITIPDAFKRQPRGKWNEFRQARMRSPEPVLHIGGEERAQGFRQSPGIAAGGKATREEAIRMRWMPSPRETAGVDHGKADDKTRRAGPSQRRKKGAVDYTAAETVAAALLASGMGNTATASGPRPRLRSGRSSARC